MRSITRTVRHPKTVAGIGATLLRLEEAGCDNVRLVRADVFDLLRNRIEALSACFVGFPDPWLGDRPASVQRRLIRPEFAALVAMRYVEADLDLPALSLATDVRAYADHARAVLSRAGWTEAYVTQDSRPAWRPISNYERKAREAARPIFDLGWTDVPSATTSIGFSELGRSLT